MTDTDQSRPIFPFTAIVGPRRNEIITNFKCN